VSLLGILELKKDTGAIVHQPESILCQLISYFLNQFPTSLSRSISLSSSVSLPAPTVVHDVPLPVLLKDTTAPPAPKSHREKDFRDVYTHWQRVPSSELVPTPSFPVKDPPLQLSVPFSDFDVPIALCKGKQSCTDHPNSHFVSYDHYTPSFR